MKTKHPSACKSVWSHCLWSHCVLLSLVISLGCGKSSDSPVSKSPTEKNSLTDESADQSVPASSPSGHEQMLTLLGNMRRLSSVEHPYIGSGEARELEKMLALHGDSAPMPLRWGTVFQLSELKLRLGSEQDALQGFTWCRDHAEKTFSNPEEQLERKIQATYQLGVAFLRLGETQNCCARNQPESCILPIRGEGIHTRQEGSRGAIECFTQVLEQTDPQSKSHLASRWLLNIAWMTLGEHPASVPAEYLIPAEAFVSSEPMVSFKNISQSLKLDTFSMSGGAIVDDFDNDHYLDLVVSPWDPSGKIQWFRNQQDGTFEDRTASMGLDGFCGGLNLLQADYDNDGDNDILVLRGGWLEDKGKHPNSLLRNNGNGTFTDVTLDVGMTRHFPTQTAAWADYDNDGDLDLYIGNESSDQIDAPCQLYRNDGSGRFENVAGTAGVTNDRYTKAVIWGDYNADRYPDLYVSNDNAENRLYRNNRDGTFTDVARDVGVEKPIKSFPVWFWDYDNDGNLDLYVSAYSSSVADLAAHYLGMKFDAEPSRLYRGDGAGNFQDVAGESGLNRPDATMGANFGDLDNDGYLDFYLGTGYPRYESIMPSVMYKNQSGKRFVDITTAGGFGHLQKGHAVAFADVDHDGDQDVFEQMGGAYPGDRFHDALYENPGFGNHWITLKLTGSRSNRSAIGTRICVEIVEEGKTRKIYRHVNSGGSFGANPLRQTIGLGQASHVKQLEVYWPTSDTTQIWTEVPMDGHFEIVEDDDTLRPLEVKRLELGSSKK